MKKSIEEHAARFDEKATEYDESKSDEYHACANLVVERAAPAADDVVLDLATGTGAIALAIAPDADRVVGRDISEGMLEEAERKAADKGIENVEFDHGTFREPEYDGPADTESSETPRAPTRSARVDIVTSNFAMHHLSDPEKREAIDVIADLEPRKFVLGDVMFFGEPDPDEPFYSPEVDDPATVGALADAFTDAGFSLTAVERVHDQVGVLVAERCPTAADVDEAPAEE
ncbi:class I SAM-dependent methyltransferase [Natrinema salifodinae]|uniref:Methyltransferase domain-containing protein n=1 Tax=Natrinema salifodinae TaxID=1202768 RepID=A0A1I0N3Q0_9EURY|nr:class I SAM-dependent methyltransferase [Natrinema salifodinae]SEV95451.1 Methyltransferase domain-containing protein [Natrinema salifodinae]